MQFLPYLGCVWLGVESLRGGLAESNRIFPQEKNDLFIKITSQRLLDQSQAGVYGGKRHIPPHFGPIRVPYLKGLNC